MKKLLLSLFLTFCALAANAMTVFSRQFNTANGLPNNNIRSLAQDAKGFIWMGSPNGLFRFDGYFFMTYRYAETGNLRLLNNNHINSCYALPDGKMLFREQGNLFSVYDTEQESFVDMPTGQKEAIYQQMRRREAPQHLLAPYQSILARGGNFINDNLGNVIVLDQTGQIWFVDRKTQETIRLKVFDKRLLSVISSLKYKVLTSERTDMIWVSTNGCGITAFNRKTRELMHITRQSGLIATDDIQDICLDRNDNLWAAEEFHGVACLSVEQKQGEIRLLDTPDGSIRSNQIRMIYQVADSLFWVVNTQGDIYEGDGRLQQLKRNTEQRVDIHSICTDHDGRLWIGSRKNGLRRPDGTWLRHTEGDVSTRLSGNNINALFCDRDGRIWAGCEEAQLDLLTGGSIGHFLPKQASPKVIIQSHDGTIWVGARTGLYAFQPDRLLEDSSQYRQVLNSRDIRYSDINCIYEDTQGRLWVGTMGDGLYRSDDGGRSFSQLTVADGLISNEIQSLIAADDEVLWIATTNGITRYRISDGHCEDIYNEYNLQANYNAEKCVCLLPSGQLAFGTNHGIVLYDTRQAQSVFRQLPLTVTDLLTNGESVIPVAGKVSLAHNQNTLTVRFSTFTFNTSTRYTYWLEGYDRQWSEPTTYSFADYKNLPPGHYTLHVKAYDSSRSANSEYQLTIVIRYPWWQTWWAYLIYIFVLAAISYAVYRQLRTVYQLRRRISIEQELTEYKLQFFTNISHEFRTPLTIIRGAMDRIRNTKAIPADLRQPVSSIQKSTDRMMRLINQLLTFRKMQNNKLSLQLEETDIVAFVRDIYLNFTDIAENKQVDYTFLPSVKSFTMFIDRQHVDKMVYNLLSNAFKYTPQKGSVTVRVKVGDLLQIIIEDTGVGIPREKQPELFQRFMQSAFSSDSMGIGLHLTKALVDVHHGQISFAENRPQGSVFTISLPVDERVYRPEDFLQASRLERPSAVSRQPDYREMAAEPMNDCPILVVEDDADVAEFLKQTLQHYFNVTVALDGQSALDLLAESHDYRLVISDVMMPVMNGYELTSHIRKDNATLAIPIILLTALTGEEKRIKGLETGADAYLTKPFDTKLLIATCRQLIEQRARLRQSYAEQPAERTNVLPEIIVDERDKQLLDQMNRWLYNHISSPTLSVDDFAEAMGYRRSIFFKKVKSLTGQTPADYIRTQRMNRAAEMLRDETVSVAEVAYQVGISEPHYFTRIFKQQFGISPKKYQQGNRPDAEAVKP